MSKLDQIRALAEAEAAEGIDMNEAVRGGSGSRLLPEGYAFGRLVEYVELGKQPQEFKGQSKDPAMEFTLGFALWGQGYQNEDGTPYIIRPYSMAQSRNEKARAFLLFKCLNYKGTAKNFGQLLGEAYLVKIKHVAKSTTDPTIVSRIDLAGFLPPLDPVSKQPYPIPEAADELYRLFLWNRPTKEAWDSLFIEGTWEAKDGKPAESKNRIQETILSALDFQGSPLQLMLGGAVAALPSAVATPAAPVAAPAAVAPATALPVAPTVVAPQVVAPLATPAIAAVPASPQAAPIVQPALAPVAAPSLPQLAVTASPSSPVLPA